MEKQKLLKIISLNIKKIRESRQLSQADLADKAKISTSHMGKLEAGNCNTNISISLLNDFANILNVSITDFFDSSVLKFNKILSIKEGKKQIIPFANKPFSEILPTEELNDVIFLVNKGKARQVLEKLIGLNNTNAILDFMDGELKTNKCNYMGQPTETMFITQIAQMMDDLLNEKPFNDTKLYLKIKHLLYVRICKDGEPKNWKFFEPIEIDLTSTACLDLLNQLKEDYKNICQLMNKQLSESPDSMLHTVSGKFIQIRTKDSKPYHPIYSDKYNRIISDKNRAFYFKKDFMNYIIKNFA